MLKIEEEFSQIYFALKEYCHPQGLSCVGIMYAAGSDSSVIFFLFQQGITNPFLHVGLPISSVCIFPPSCFSHLSPTGKPAAISARLFPEYRHTYETLEKAGIHKGPYTDLYYYCIFCAAKAVSGQSSQI